MSRSREQISRIIEAVDVESRFGEQVRVSTLPARHVENAGAGRQSEDVNESGCFFPIALEREERLVLE